MKLVLVFILCTVAAFSQTNVPPPLPGVRSITVPVPPGFAAQVISTNGWATIDFVPAPGTILISGPQPLPKRNWVLPPPIIDKIDTFNTNSCTVHWVAGVSLLGLPSGAIAFELQHRVTLPNIESDGWEDVASMIATNITQWQDEDIPEVGRVEYRMRSIGRAGQKGKWSEIHDFARGKVTP